MRHSCCPIHLLHDLLFLTMTSWNHVHLPIMHMPSHQGRSLRALRARLSASSMQSSAFLGRLQLVCLAAPAQLHVMHPLKSSVVDAQPPFATARGTYATLSAATAPQSLAACPAYLP